MRLLIVYDKIKHICGLDNVRSPLILHGLKRFPRILTGAVEDHGVVHAN